MYLCSVSWCQIWRELRQVTKEERLFIRIKNKIYCQCPAFYDGLMFKWREEGSWPLYIWNRACRRYEKSCPFNKTGNAKNARGCNFCFNIRDSSWESYYLQSVTKVAAKLKQNCEQAPNKRAPPTLTPWWYSPSHKLLQLQQQNSVHSVPICWQLFKLKLPKKLC